MHQTMRRPLITHSPCPPPPAGYDSISAVASDPTQTARGDCPMANTFPSSGNVGIGTTTPDTLLTVDTGGNSVLAMARIKGQSPVWVFGSTATGYCGNETFIGLVTHAGDYLSEASSETRSSSTAPTAGVFTSDAITPRTSR
jgi:hypothetical protein